MFHTHYYFFPSMISLLILSGFATPAKTVQVSNLFECLAALASHANITSVPIRFGHGFTNKKKEGNFSSNCSPLLL